MMIEVSEDALDSIKKTAEQVQKERDKLLDVLHMIKAHAGNPESVWKLANESIAAMQTK